jgi:hypothetical protein
MYQQGNAVPLRHLWDECKEKAVFKRQRCMCECIAQNVEALSGIHCITQMAG